ncbi:MAG: hypothetical protein ACK6CT_13845 [Planctomycetia bacterium]|jgi:hypothetical protein
MKVRGESGLARVVTSAALLVIGGSLPGCKSVSEKYIALEVWKYERFFGHLPPGFVPPGAQQPAAAPGRVCGQGGPCQSGCQGTTEGCDQCTGGQVLPGGQMLPGGPPAAAGAPAGPGGAPAIGPNPVQSNFRGVVSKPVVISDEVVIP